MSFYVGLDVGQAQEFTALALLEKTSSPVPDRPGDKQNHHAVRYLERFPLGTPFPDVCTKVARMFSTASLAGATLGVDLTGVGRPFLDMLRRTKLKARIQPITITGGHKAIPTDGNGILVPRTELVSTLQVLLQSRRLKVAPTLTEAETLVRELMNFKVKVSSSANEIQDLWREGPHDDLVLAVAVAAWLGERPLRRLQVY